MAGFKEIDLADLVDVSPGALKKVIAQYNRNVGVISKRVDRLEGYAEELSDILGTVVARDIVVTPKIAGYTKVLEGEGLPKFPKMEYINGEIRNAETGKILKASQLQTYILATNSFYTDEANKTSLSGVNGVYYQTAEYLNHFLRPEDRIDTSKHYRFQGSTKQRAQADIKAALNKLTDTRGNYKLRPKDLDPKGFWEAWNRFKDNYASNVYRAEGNNKMEAVEVFARDLYLPSKAVEKDERGRFKKRKSPSEILKDMGYKNFSSYIQHLQDSGQV